MVVAFFAGLSGQVIASFGYDLRKASRVLLVVDDSGPPARFGIASAYLRHCLGVSPTTTGR
jgi:hypothetical protein